MAWPICRRFEAHFTRLAVSRARLRDGSRIEISSAMMPITTSSSTSVKPVFRFERFIAKLLYDASPRASFRATPNRRNDGRDECNTFESRKRQDSRSEEHTSELQSQFQLV